MTNKLEKCPNCGHKFKEGEKYCPNCDLFVPIDDKDDSVKGFNLNETRPFNKFNEKDIKERDEGESLFKHRTKNMDEPHEPQKEHINEEKNNLEEIVAKDVSQPEESPVEEEQQKADSTESMVSSEHSHDSNLNETPKGKETTNVPIKRDEQKNDATNVDDNLPTRSENASTSIQDSIKKKWLIGCVILIIIIIIGGLFYSNQKKKSEEADRVALVSSITDEVDNLYLTKNHDYLESGITQSDITKASDALKKLKTKKGYDSLKELLDDAEDKFKKQAAVNALFNKPIINGNQLNDDVYVTDAAAVSLNKVTKDKDGFYTLYNEAIDVANSQKEELKQVEEKVAVVFKEDKVVETATRDEYQAAKDAVDTLKNEELKGTYNADLAKVDTFLTEKEEKAEKEAAEAAALEEEQKNAAALLEKQQAANNASSNASSNSSSSNSTNGYRWGNRQDATIDLSDPAWTWGPGIQNEVMSEVIKRGYVVDGGYTLVPKYIENGEGYYDLYATTNSKIFPNSKASEFPLFVVTINDKTGSFYGNGPN